MNDKGTGTFYARGRERLVRVEVLGDSERWKGQSGNAKQGKAPRVRKAREVEKGKGTN